MGGLHQPAIARWSVEANAYPLPALGARIAPPWRRHARPRITDGSEFMAGSLVPGDVIRRIPSATAEQHW